MLTTTQTQAAAPRPNQEVGGRLMIGPSGELEASGGLRWALSTIPAREARKSFAIERRLCRRLRDGTFARSVKCLVLAEGEPTSNGWLVLGGR